MITEFEKQISNLSYTQKDLIAVYDELLTLAKKISYKWDPTISNESDPGVILLKLNALICDKNNYNIDKNVLETFPLSVTQDVNARQLFDQLAYYMHWYIGATTDVTMSWSGDKDKEVKTYTIPQFTTICDADNTVVYTIVDINKVISTDGVPTTVSVIQGVPVDVSINSSKLITSANLDNNNRLYLDDFNIAENGIFICNEGQKNYSAWHRVDNLALVAQGEFVYKFGVDAISNTCYIEFPEYIDTIIQDGLNITYIKTDGLNGNIASNVLEKFYQDSATGDLTNENVKIVNYSAVTNGYNPETIDSAYKNYKKTSGTFNTLVSLRDYINAIYTSGYVSNCFVCDRTNDVQSTFYIVHNDGSEDVLERQTDESLIDAFGLKVYGLQFVDNPYNTQDYNKSFNFVSNFDGSDNEGISLVDKNIKAIYNYIDSIKSIQHDFGTLQKDEILFIKNKYPINCKIVPTYKLTNTEQNEVTNNILSALYSKLNAREIDFSEPVRYDYIYDIIQESDERIKSVILDSLEYKAFAVYFDSKDNAIKEVCVSTLPEDYVYGFLSNKDFYYQGDGNPAVFYNIKLGKDSPNPEYRKMLFNSFDELKNWTSIHSSYENYTGVYLDGCYFGVKGNPPSSIDMVYLYYSGYPAGSASYTGIGPSPLTEFTSGKIYVDTLGGNSYNYNSSLNKLDLINGDILEKFKNEICAKSILAGKTQLLVSDNKYQYKLNQSFQKEVNNVKEISTNVNINFKTDSNTATYVLKDNENIQLFTPNLLDVTSYSTYVKYECNLDTGLLDNQKQFRFGLNSNPILFHTTVANKFYAPVTPKALQGLLQADKWYNVIYSGKSYNLQCKSAIAYAVGWNGSITPIPYTYIGYGMPYRYINKKIDTEPFANTIVGDSNVPFGIFCLDNNVYFETTSATAAYFTVTEFSSYFKSYIPANSDYELKGTQWLTVYWKSNDDNNYYDYYNYTAGSVIRPSFDLYSNANGVVAHSKLTDINNTHKGTTSETTGDIVVNGVHQSVTDYVSSLLSDEYVLTSTKSITERKVNRTILINNTTLCYWILNSKIHDSTVNIDYYRLFNNSNEYVLKANEYFMYTDLTKSALNILGAGTKLVKSDRYGSTYDWQCKAISYEDVDKYGFEALDSVWKSLASYDGELSATEMQFITLGKDMALKLTSKDSMPFNITISGEKYEPTNLSNFNISYGELTVPDALDSISTWTIVPDVVLSDSYWQARSLLNIKTDTNVAQRIVDNQLITFTSYDNTVTTSASNTISGSVELKISNGKFLHNLTEIDCGSDYPSYIDIISDGNAENFVPTVFYDEYGNSMDVDVAGIDLYNLSAYTTYTISSSTSNPTPPKYGLVVAYPTIGCVRYKNSINYKNVSSTDEMYSDIFNTIIQYGNPSGTSYYISGNLLMYTINNLMCRTTTSDTNIADYTKDTKYRGESITDPATGTVKVDNGNTDLSGVDSYFGFVVSYVRDGVTEYWVKGTLYNSSPSTWFKNGFVDKNPNPHTVSYPEEDNAIIGYKGKYYILRENTWQEINKDNFSTFFSNLYTTSEIHVSNIDYSKDIYNYVGITTTDVSNNTTTSTVVIDGTNKVVVEGAIVKYNNKYYQYIGGNWVALTAANIYESIYFDTIIAASNIDRTAHKVYLIANNGGIFTNSYNYNIVFTPSAGNPVYMLSTRSVDVDGGERVDITSINADGTIDYPSFYLYKKSSENSERIIYNDDGSIRLLFRNNTDLDFNEDGFVDAQDYVMAQDLPKSDFASKIKQMLGIQHGDSPEIEQMYERAVTKFDAAKKAFGSEEAVYNEIATAYSTANIDSNKSFRLQFRLPAGEYIIPIYNPTDNIDAITVATIIDDNISVISPIYADTLVMSSYITRPSAVTIPHENKNTFWSYNTNLNIVAMYTDRATYGVGSTAQSPIVCKRFGVFNPFGETVRNPCVDIPFTTSGAKIFFYKLSITDETKLVNLVISLQFNSTTPYNKIIDILPIYKYNLNKDLPDNMLSIIRALDKEDLYNYTYKVDKTEEIKDPLNASSFNDTNHIYNKFTINMLDTGTSDILITNNIK